MRLGESVEEIKYKKTIHRLGYPATVKAKNGKEQEQPSLITDTHF
jgi:hypothetical protein